MIDKVTIPVSPEIVEPSVKINEVGMIEIRFIYKNEIVDKGQFEKLMAKLRDQSGFNEKAKFYYLQNTLFSTSAIDSNQLYFLSAYGFKVADTKMCGGASCLLCGDGGCTFCRVNKPLVDFKYNSKIYKGCEGDVEIPKPDPKCPEGSENTSA
jgi:hypothetical protein